MTGTTVLQFRTLAEMALFIKAFHPDSYVINTQVLTLLAPLSAFQIAVAIEQYSAAVIRQAETV
ncbi:MAG: hypothetical protein M3Q06_13505 [Bacteroidota bacterium]|nr:hypothetical protein [Bacteroidota bacterium]